MPERASIAGVILAGGLSRRMGGVEKSLIELGGVPLVAHARNRLAPQVARIVISANGDPERFARFCLPVAGDAVPGYAGPLAGIHSAMLWARENLPEASHVLSAAADTPFFPSNLCEKLAAAAATGKIVLAASGGKTHQVFGLWPVQLAGELEDYLANGGRKVMAFVEAHEWSAAEFAILETGRGPIDPFFNINTPEDVDLAVAIAAAVT